MPVWVVNTKKDVRYKVGQRLGDRFVAEIQRKVPLSSLMANHNIRAWNKINPDQIMDLVPEELRDHARLEAPQLNLVHSV